VVLLNQIECSKKTFFNRYADMAKRGWRTGLGGSGPKKQSSTVSLEKEGNYMDQKLSTARGLRGGEER